MVKGPGTVIFTCRVVCLLRKRKSSTSTACLRLTLPTIRRHRIGMPRAVERGPGTVDVHALERGGEPVRVALAPRFPVGDDVEPGVLLGADCEHGRIILRFFQKRFFNPPKLSRAHTRRKAPCELLAVDQPFRLRVAADQRGWKEHSYPAFLPCLFTYLRIWGKSS